MNDGPKSIKHSGLRNEWSILIESFIEDVPSILPEPKELAAMCNERGVTTADLEKYAKHLSQQRKSVNNQIENIKTSIDEKYAVIENLDLVKSDTAPVFKEIERLNEQGENLSREMVKINKEAQSLRKVENYLKSKAISESHLD